MYTVVEGPGTDRLADYITKLGQLQPMSRTSVSEVDAKIRRILGTGFGSHSAKRGAITQLFAEVVKGNTRLEEVQRLAKHQSLDFASSIQRRPGYHRVGVGHAESNQQVTDHVEASEIFRKFLDDIPQEKVRHTITRTRRTSKVALPKDYSIPLHIKQGIPRMSVKKLREMMNEATGDRFDETLETLLRLPEQASTIPLYKSFLY